MPSTAQPTQLAFHIGPTPPSDVSGSTVWISTALANARPPDHPGRTVVIYDAGAVGQQEPNGWYYNGRWYLICQGGSSARLLTATDPAGDWTFVGNLLGGGGTVDTGGVAHAGLYIEGNNLYFTYINGVSGLSVKCAVSTLALMEQAATSVIASTAAFTATSVLLAKAGNVLPNLSQFGNTQIAKINGQYVLYYEATLGSGGDSWITSTSVCATVNGTYVTQGGPLMTMNPLFGLSLEVGISRDFPTPPASSIVSGGLNSAYLMGTAIGPLIQENGQFVILSHCGAIGTGEGFTNSELYRFTSPDTDGLTWTCDNGGYPIYTRRDNRYEGDQTADPVPVQGPNGIWWCFYTAASNPDGRFVIKGFPMSPTMLMHDGSRWIEMDQMGGAGNMERKLFRRARYPVSGFPIFPFDDVPVDAGTTNDFPIVLPTAFNGNHVRITNTSTIGTYSTSIVPNTGTIQVTPRSGDAIYGPNPVIRAGETVEFWCTKSKVWSRTPGGMASFPQTFASKTLTNSDLNSVNTVASAAVATINTGLLQGFGCLFTGAGALTTAGTATVTDERTTGAANPSCSLVNTGVDTYKLIGSKA